MQTNNTTHNARMIFARNLKEFRNRNRLSQEELADAAGLHRTYVGSVERGERNISIDNMERLASAMKINVKELLNDE
ncbi:MAG: helix-turn-helix transcriptional regulator [Methylovulum sp.]|uniref:helix-turn-helix domain-containing protein n=1 Tax=Methylovulum sp. TaxID=1916980 RepID=UPI00261F6A2B|nr:helix-turn-helix transcriptional regulator [Methylovulum sp.]MDD2725238.1 helix-turn-helix transcriptional regulator [Methylovulum sp.]MDD5124782.1 helix-turn-helix transcriptional regulator [Methylovulum sp.]